MAASCELDSYPPFKDIVRSETPIGGYIIKKVNESMCKMTFCVELNYKLSHFIAKSVGPKSGHLALSLRKYFLTQIASQVDE
mmetsp:Transcript_12613/g.12424  ORF Transcript_12613/g.12424 Transcript_12613/m.12424 type:complete len:82 (-) Transcript_12613:43-288(-)